MSSIYKKFRTLDEPAVFGEITSMYDQPTYMTFKLVFAPNRDVTYNNAGRVSSGITNYDIMPHPLFGEKGSDNVDSRETYSAIDFLMDSNEYTRARMLEEFIKKFNDLQNNFQWYFTSIDGIDDLLKVNPKSGMRVPMDKKLTINVMEGLDLRMTHLLSMYRKIAWDDTYQRWVLPDMMRYFTLRIYITEFRTFHTVDPLVNSNTGSTNDMVLSILDGVLPTWVIDCEMCEFDIESIKYNYATSLSVTETPQDANLSFDVKVGKVYETQIYPLFKNSYIVDRSINGFDRSKSSERDSSEPFDSTSVQQNNNYMKNLYADMIAQNTLDQEGNHTSGLPFNQNSNSTTLLNTSKVSKDGWVNNAVKLGSAIAKNFVKDEANKLKVMNIPKLGFSISEALSAIQSKDIFTALGLVRKSISTLNEDSTGPSDKLSDKIVDDTFRSFLTSISKSSATDDGSRMLIDAAVVALTDKGVWGALKDMSLATDMVSNDEVNTDNKILGVDTYKNKVMSETANDRSWATDLDGGGTIVKTPFGNAAPSAATSSKIIL